jgi:hypothetical protein
MGTPEQDGTVARAGEATATDALVEGATAVRVIRLVTLALCAGFVAMFVLVVARRFSYPYELEWMTGSILDHIERLRSGQPLYTEPSLDWTPFLYPPLYYWLAHVPSFQACRLLSLAATLGQGACVWRLARRNGATAAWSAIAMGLFFACFGLVGFYYDLERCDSLFVSIMTFGVVLLLETRTVGRAALAGAVFGLGFFAKQPALLFSLSAGAALLLRRPKRLGIVFLALAGLVIGGGSAWWTKRTGGWFYFYVFRMPAAHGIEFELVPTVIKDLGTAFLLTLSTGVIVLPLLKIRSWSRRPGDRLVFSFILGGAFVASVTSRLHAGGDANVLMYWSTFACAATGVFCSRLEGWIVTPSGRMAIYGLVIIQLCLLFYDPRSQIPGPQQGEAQRALEQQVQALERRYGNGRVIVPYHGHLTGARNAHAMAVTDTEGPLGGIPASVRRDIAGHKFAAVLTDSTLPDLEQPVTKLMFRHYFAAERVDFPGFGLPVGLQTTPRWILLPRQQPLEEASDELLFKKVQLEMAFAELEFTAELHPAGEPQSSVERRADDLARGREVELHKGSAR